MKQYTPSAFIFQGHIWRFHEILQVCTRQLSSSFPILHHFHIIPAFRASAEALFDIVSKVEKWQNAIFQPADLWSAGAQSALLLIDEVESTCRFQRLQRTAGEKYL